MRKPLIAGNWKMHGSQAMTASLINAFKVSRQAFGDHEVLVIPPFVYLPEAASLLDGSDIQLGAQTVSAEPEGAFTGEVSVSMLAECRCQYVLTGHSERRHIFGETNQVVIAKFFRVLEAGLTPVLCVGETLAQREAGHTEMIVQEQLADLIRLKDNRPASSSFVVAYEPVWAIGTGHAASPEQAQSVHAFIRHTLAGVDSALAEETRILYGGSVKPNNAAALSEMTDIDGALVGGASLDADAFIEIGKKWNKS